jgi:hypothetical protein
MGEDSLVCADAEFMPILTMPTAMAIVIIPLKYLCGAMVSPYSTFEVEHLASSPKSI